MLRRSAGGGSFRRTIGPGFRSTTPLLRLSKEVKRRADVVGIFPNEESIIRLVGALLMEQNEEWQTQNRYMNRSNGRDDKLAIEAQPLQTTPKAA